MTNQSRVDARYFRQAVVAHAHGKCEVCGFFCPWIGEIHHIKPVNEGGNGWPDNLVHLCPNCHRVVEQIATRLADNPNFEAWILETYGAETTDRIIAIAYRTWGNEPE
jgi:5-methylcytosine-specific restriction endonuclease McrA